MDGESVETIWKQIGSLLDQFTPKKYVNYLVNAGYASS
jgi:hypothetical protein